MKKEEFNMLVKRMKAVYSDPKFIADKNAFNVWYSLLNDLEYQFASMAIQKYMLLNKFSPSIADIRKEYVSIAYSPELEESKAWELVISTLREVDTKSLARKRFGELPELIGKAIGGYNQFLELVNNPCMRQAVKSSFSKSYKELIEKDIEMKMLQPEIRNIIKGNLTIESEEEIKQIEIDANLERNVCYEGDN